jgi:DNA helicase-2/ATP-dependent DNA helicase PcrA
LLAPAGYGKTELIAETVKYNPTVRSLVLTHTNAGTEAIRQRMKKLRVPTTAYAVDTIAGWSLRLAKSFPRTTNVDFSEPRGDQWDLVYSGIAALLTVKAIRKVITASYGGVFVDEYQDCSLHQHRVILGLSECIPTRVLGDPLQGIFNFGGQSIVSWDDDVLPNFPALPRLTVPWRWKGTNPALEEWLAHVRQAVENRQPINLLAAPPGAITFTQLPADPRQHANVRRQICMRSTCRLGEYLLAVLAWPNQCRQIAALTRGKFRSPEPVECEELFSSARALDEASDGHEKARITFDFACECLTQIKTEIGDTVQRLIAGGRLRAAFYKNRLALEAFQRILDVPSVKAVREALQACLNISRVKKARAELVEDMLEALKECQNGGQPTVEEAAIAVRERLRYLGRRPSRFTVSRTLLMKGQQFDHVIVLDADALDARNLYVALTRGSRTLHVLAASPILSPGGLS